MIVWALVIPVVIYLVMTGRSFKYSDLQQSKGLRRVKQVEKLGDLTFQAGLVTLAAAAALQTLVFSTDLSRSTALEIANAQGASLGIQDTPETTKFMNLLVDGFGWTFLTGAGFLLIGVVLCLYYKSED